MTGAALSDVTIVLALLTGLLMLPIVPAYILYKGLSSDAVVEGPFQGLTVRLSGAFAAYFVLVLLSGSLIYQYYQPGPRFEELTVRGTVALADAVGPFEPNLLEVALVPPTRTELFTGGNRRIQFSVKAPFGVRGDRLSTSSFAGIIMSYPGFESATALFETDPSESSYKARYDTAEGMIVVDPTIVMTPDRRAEEEASANAEPRVRGLGPRPPAAAEAAVREQPSEGDRVYLRKVE
jgi:hypothetical protein